MTIYLDNASTSWPKPPQVLEEMTRFLAEDAANPGRGAHRMALASEKMINDCRLKIARFFNAESPERIIFGLNASDALNTAIHGSVYAATAHLQNNSKPHIITTHIEHNSIRRPINTLEEAGWVDVTRIETEPDGRINPQTMADAVRKNTILIAFTHASNVLGDIQPIGEIVQAVRQKSSEVLVLSDASQTAGVVPIDAQKLGVDLLAAPGHKGMLGPTGTGVLYISPRAYDPDSSEPQRMTAFRSGGTGGDSTTATQPRDLPVYFEAGTPNTVGIAGLSAGVDYVMERGIEKIGQHEMQLIDRITDELAKLADSDSAPLTLHGTGHNNPHVGLISITVKGYSPGELATILDSSFKIAVRPGLHCAPGAHQAIGTFPDGTLRVSTGPFTKEEEVAAVCEAMRSIVSSRVTMQ